MTVIPKTHPRFESLQTRERLVRGFDCGLVAREGLLAHGRGEAFDYLLGESTGSAAKKALGAAAAMLLLAQRPVISVNGNVAALCPGEIIELSESVGAQIEVNLFYSSAKRMRDVAAALKKHGARRVLGTNPKSSRRLSGTDSARRFVDADGIFCADVVLVPLEDGDRTAALVGAGKKVITFDLNPLSRTSQTASVSIVDNITRGMGVLVRMAGTYSKKSGRELEKIVDCFDNGKNLASSIREIRANLAGRARIA